MNKKTLFLVPFRNKKGIAMEWVVTITILIVAMIIIIMITRNLLSDSSAAIKEKQDGVFQDCDNDGVPNLQDRCCATPGGKVEFDGCTGPDDKRIACGDPGSASKCLTK